MKINKIIKAVIFDFDGTLADDIGLHIDSYTKAFGSVGIELTPDEKAHLIGKPIRVTVKEILDRHNNKMYKKIRQNKINIYKNYLRGKYVLFKDAEPVIKKLSKNFSLAILTSSIMDQLQWSCPEGFLNIFDIIITAENNLKPKPSPDGLLFIARKLDLKSEKCVYVGDMKIDIIAAKNAGMIAIGIKRRKTHEDLSKADYVIKDLKQLKKLLF